MKKMEIHHSEEFRDVISKFPKIFNSILAISLLAILIICALLSWFIQSPEMILANVRVTAEKPPISIVAESNGKIKLFEFSPQKQFQKGSVIGVIENLADESKILRLKDSITKYQATIEKLNIKSFDFALSDNLGEVQESYFLFIAALHELNNNKNNNEYDLQSLTLKKQIEQYNLLIRQRNKLKKIKNKEIAILAEKYRTDSSLVAKKMAVINELENSSLGFLREKENLQNIDIENIRNQLNISDAEGNLNLSTLQRKLKLSNVELKLLQAFQQLILNINNWEKKYLIKVPVDGQVDYINFISSNQFVSQGSLLFNVLPNNNKIIGQVLMPSEGAGKVKVGQTVFIKLSAFPYQEFGRLTGKIKNISLIPNESQYLVIVEMPKGLQSDSGKNLSFGKNMEGQAEIIIEKRRLIYKIFDRIIKAFEKSAPIKEKNTEEIDGKKDK
ncbi:hypothetical protein BBH99_00255 [Chryseobacterium contaminans]|uniref:HlyD family secretion protein n=1 Tax=Chryseobacterium contaminans TaxID=1423959 RepID=A0A1M6VNI2_9FLAO|nr:HlyD family efflux transporter periplasmic adaptor subunit [Chryseobacterium contaminans]OCA80569.1 hypothetical protein BBH99_00255 [Chryseobacterium contaminans]SHK82806.1 HlyD family secretion protein [Chryseobacterium contaminans]